MIIPVVMAGGVGTRLWPMSREHFPKQFLPLYGQHTMLQETLLRLEGMEIATPIVITNEMHRFIVAEQLRQIEKLEHNIILEPCGKNTAPAIALAALHAMCHDETAVLLVLAADHVIGYPALFQETISSARELVREGNLVTFGIVPAAPETGYGYIQRGIPKGSAFSVKRFVEKPPYEKAVAYLESGDYYWNSGMFMFTAASYLQELEQYNPDMLQVCRDALAKATVDDNFIRLDRKTFQTCPEDSIDYAVMEKTQHSVVIPLDAQWSDVGSWAALWDIDTKDDNNNVSIGDVFMQDTQNSYVNTTDKFVATIGLDNIVVVNTKDALLVADKSQVQDVKKVVAFLKQHQRKEHVTHRQIYRPWGKYDVIEMAEGFHINRITINPGGRFSLQMHYHRAEHWTVMKGTAKVVIEDQTQLITENQSIFIPMGKKHYLENPGKIPLEMIEVRSGSYLEENDIVRFE